MKKNKLLYIEGLRALAVVLVIIYHSGYGVLNGGFIGVDVFLVISGFLMAYTVYSKDAFKLFEFYNKRLMRLLPHLAVMLMLVSVVSYLLLPPYLLTETAQSGAIALISLSNIYFYLQADYFGPDSLLRPFIHTWSLGLEVQFYILFGLIVRFLEKRYSIIAILTLSIISFYINVSSVNEDQSSAYFLLSSRFWEFGIGSLIYFIPQKYIVQNKVTSLLSVISIFVLISTSYYFHSSFSFPGYLALLPVLSTCSLILYIPANRVINTIFTWRWMIYLGGISYGLYLWHQPIFALIRVSLLNTFTFEYFVFGLLMSFILSHYLKSVVEDKFRGIYLCSWKGPLLLISFSIPLFSFAYYSTITSGFKSRLNDMSRDSSYYYDVTEAKDSGVKILKETREEHLFSRPFDVSSNKYKVLIIGDSMGEDLASSLTYFARDLPSVVDVRLYRLDSNCFYFSVDSDVCTSKLQNTSKVIDSLKPDYILITALWKKGANFELLSSYFSRWKVEHAGELVILGSTGFNDMYSLAYELAKSSKPLRISEVNSRVYEHKRSKFEFGNARAYTIAKELNIHFWDRKDTFCDVAAQTCSILFKEDMPYIWDNAHLTSKGMEQTFNYFNSNINKILNIKPKRVN